MIVIDTREFEKTMKNAVQYAQGFIDGIQFKEPIFHNELGQAIKVLCGKYIDSSAKLDPESLHHVYEWDNVGNEGARLFDIVALADTQFIRFNFNFKQSTTMAPNATTPFFNKAEIMESGRSVVVQPSQSDTLVFEGEDGENVFTTDQVVIENPGGVQTNGAFDRVVKEFFLVYLKQGMLRSLLKDMETADEFLVGWGNNARYNVGMKQGKEYLSVTGGIV